MPRGPKRERRPADVIGNAGQRSLQPDDAFLVTPGSTHSLNASGSQPAQFLHFVLARSSELDQPAEHDTRPPNEAASVGALVASLGADRVLQPRPRA
jgi:hypothetical protein